MIVKTDKRYWRRGFKTKLLFFFLSVVLFILGFQAAGESVLNHYMVGFLLAVLAMIALEIFLKFTYKCPDCRSRLKRSRMDDNREYEYYHECQTCQIRWYTNVRNHPDGG